MGEGPELLPPYECEDDVVRTAAPAPIGGAEAGLGPPPPEPGDSSGLGSGYVPWYGPPPRTVTGRLLAPSGTSGLAAARTLCADAAAMRLCAEASSTEAAPVRASATYSITLRADGSVDASKVTAGAIADAVLASCLEKALAARTFPAGTPTLIYAVEIGAGRPRAIRPRGAGATVAGRLPEEVVQRIVRPSFGRLRTCYEALRRADPSAKGTVSTAFVIDETGAVTSAKTDAGTITDPAMRSCVQGIFKRMSFPEPAAGKVDVTYAIAFRVD